MKDVTKRLVILLGLIFILCRADDYYDDYDDYDEGTVSETPHWAHWQQWSVCSSKCGFGQHYRVRQCADPPPTGDDPKSCKGDYMETTPCYTGPCAESPSKAIIFSKGSHQKYVAHGTPARYLSLYLHFKPLTNDATLLHRYSGCDKTKCSHNVYLMIKGNQVRLELQNAYGRTKLTTDNTVKLGKWQTIYIQITRRLIIIRLDDNFRKVTKFPNADFPTGDPLRLSKKLQEFDEINFDADMTVGCDRYLKNAFVGSILKLRHNFKDMSLIHTPDWVGFGAPIAQKNIETEEIDSPEAHSRFLNKYYTKVHFEFPEHKKLHLEMSVYFMGLDGLLLFNYGETEGSYMSLALHQGALRFCFNVGAKTACQKSILLQITRWYFISVSISESVAELRVDKGRAVIVTPTGGVYTPKATVLIGGSDLEEWTTLGKLTRVDIGFDGVINELNVNGKLLHLKQTVLFDRNGRVNADGYSLSAHVSEVYEYAPSKVTLRCDASLFARKGGVVSINWVESDQLISGGGGEKIIKQVPGNRFESALILKPNHHHEGIYACIVSHDGFRIMTHTFPVLRALHKLPVGWKAQVALAVVPSTLLGIFIIACGICFLLKRRSKPKQGTGSTKGKESAGDTKFIGDVERGINSMTKLLSENEKKEKGKGKNVQDKHIKIKDEKGQIKMGKKVKEDQTKGKKNEVDGAKAGDKKATDIQKKSNKDEDPDKAEEDEADDAGDADDADDADEDENDGFEDVSGEEEEI